MQVTEADYQRFQHFLKDKSGIALTGNKKYLVSNRLSSVCVSNGVDTLTALVELIERNPTSALAKNVIDAMTTNETFWFRDNNQFRLLEEKLLPQLAEKNRQIKVWSAACSTGQEPYSISLCAESFLKDCAKPANIQITATDISDKTITQAKQGIYADFELERGLDADIIRAHFTGVRDGSQISSVHRSRTRFKTFNLLDDFKMIGSFDVIFCRNVLLYFATPTKIEILQKLRSALNVGGYLFLSSSEMLPREIDGFVTIRELGGKCYQKL